MAQYAAARDEAAETAAGGSAGAAEPLRIVSREKARIEAWSTVDGPASRT